MYVSRLSETTCCHATLVSIFCLVPPPKSKGRLAFSISCNIWMTYCHREAWWQGGDNKLLYLHMTKIKSKPTSSRFWAAVLQPLFNWNFSNIKNIKVSGGKNANTDIWEPSTNCWTNQHASLEFQFKRWWLLHPSERRGKWRRKCVKRTTKPKGMEILLRVGSTL